MSDHGCGKGVLASLEVSAQLVGVLRREVGLPRSSKPTTGPQDYISIWLAMGKLARSRARQISMSPWIVVAIQSTSQSVGAVVHDNTFAGMDELNCGMVRFLFTYDDSEMISISFLSHMVDLWQLSRKQGADSTLKQAVKVRTFAQI
jgi:hypothetical protein